MRLRPIAPITGRKKAILPIGHGAAYRPGGNLRRFIVHLELEAHRWHVINDGVMGGKSTSEVLPHQPHLMFRGRISLENDGGFASARCRFRQGFAGIRAFRLVVRGDGRSYQLRLRADEEPGTLSWRAVFATDGSTQSIDIPLAAFEPVRRGRRVENTGALAPDEMKLLGFLLADRHPGAFSLEVHSIEALQGGDHEQ
jgi:monofunctional biosynthetic peptidoglycan transglycosylase